MVILIVTPTYVSYRIWRKANFPYIKNMMAGDFEWVNPDDDDKCRGFERGTIYFNPYYVKVSDWFGERFTEVQMIGKPRHHSFGSELYSHTEQTE